MLDLRQKDAETLLRLLEQNVPDAEVWGYGSRLKGHSHSASDLDLVLRNPSDLSMPQTRLAQLRDALSESDLPILVDVVDWARIPESFRREIEKEHCVMRQAGRPKSDASCLKS
ncbi:MAG TPA: nucleotidyltransferase domain-containing protein [Gallionella sp.]|nr:nucleotidyltransferase domain-containing protein [Gallionella sp.]